MNRSYYSAPIQNFLTESPDSIIGKLSTQYVHHNLKDLQLNAWREQVKILKDQLRGLSGQVYFEFAIPRMGKRVDNIVLVGSTIFVIEFKVGAESYDHSTETQVIDYALDLKNFHEGSHDALLIPILVATNAADNYQVNYEAHTLHSAVKCNATNLRLAIESMSQAADVLVEVNSWEGSAYKPTPTIVEAAQALYKGHNVKEISRSDAGRINLTRTTNCINQIIENSKKAGHKSICFVTGVPVAGKTLAGLNIANERMKADEDEHAVILSGNRPLVEVLREALAADLFVESSNSGSKVTKEEARRRASAFIQNIHHFRDEYLKDKKAPTEKVVVFDEAQRAWNERQVQSFMKRRRDKKGFSISEPEFLVGVMDRHERWCCIVCLIGGGQEINTGEAGLEEWVVAINNKFPHWKVFYSAQVLNDSTYLRGKNTREWLESSGNFKVDLHLAVNVRSFRAENVSSFVRSLLDLNVEQARHFLASIIDKYPVALTRSLNSAKDWLKANARGSERFGIIASSGARRLRAQGLDVKNEIEAPHWFLNPDSDVRSSYYMEDVATEFDIQGLEIDFACVAWGANLYIQQGKWQYQMFRGSRWVNVNAVEERSYLKNTYRVLLTRARQGMVIFLPEGKDSDHTRPERFYNETYDYLAGIGIPTL